MKPAARWLDCMGWRLVSVDVSGEATPLINCSDELSVDFTMTASLLSTVLCDASGRYSVRKWLTSENG